MAASAAKFQLVTGFRGPVTAEVASSSLVVPAIFLKELGGFRKTIEDPKRTHFVPFFVSF